MNGERVWAGSVETVMVGDGERAQVGGGENGGVDGGENEGVGDEGRGFGDVVRGVINEERSWADGGERVNLDNLKKIILIDFSQ